MTWRDVVVGVIGLAFGLLVGLQAQHISCRRAKIEGIKCIADLVNCERKLEAK